MGKPRGCYTAEELENALARVASGEKYAAVARDTPIPLRTLFKKIKQQAEIGSIQNQWRGPKPIIAPELEADLVEWITAIQRVGLPPGRREIMRKTNQIYASIQPISTRNTAAKSLSSSWYQRFRERHPELSDRRAQIIAHVRNMVNQESVKALFATLAKLYIEYGVDASRVYNMDETSFMPSSKSRSVVAVKDLTNV